MNLAIALGNEKNIKSSDRTDVLEKVMGESKVGKEDELSSVGEEGKPSSEGGGGDSSEENNEEF
jgi:hypothetical protein